MKNNFTILILVFFSLIQNKSTNASNIYSEKNSGKSFHSDEYKPGIIIIKVRPDFRSGCMTSSISIPQLNKIFSEISVYDVKKKFPKTKAPSEAVNKYGHKLIDLSLIYQLQFSPVVKIEKAIELIKLSGVVEYAEPLFINKMDFTPNDPKVASEYYLSKINAYNAWDIWKGDTNVVIGIVDSGTDWDHPDLQGNIKYNYLDPIDGLDNDNDGYTDNFRGWDVSEDDNDPMVVNSWHGSHVSGCAAAVTDNATGVASPGFKCKFLPVKSCLDASTTSIDDGYDGITYAADHGAQIINCSWGRTGNESNLEKDVVDYATNNKNALIVAAAGNNGQDQAHYPAAYPNVISVAATTNTDGKASFSNIHETVDVCAPGKNILSTYFNNTYDSLDGTSMASPIAAGCAAMIKSRFPSLSALQVGEQLRATCDNINGASGNAAYIGRIGKGRVNLFKAVTDSVSPGVILKGNKIKDGNDDVFIPGDTLSIACLLENLLRPTTNLVCTLSTTNSNVQILQSTFNAGVIQSLDTLSNFILPYRVLVKPTAPLNTEVVFRVTLNDGAWNDIYNFSVIVNVDYVNIAINNVASSITSKSMIGYNLPGQDQGLGFTYMNSPSLLYDMGLMIGAQGTQVSDNVRNDQGNDEDFASFLKVTAVEPGIISDFDVDGVFKDNGLSSSNPLSLVVTHHAYAWVAAPDDNYIMVQYFIKNDGNSLVNLYAGLFADWDIDDYSKNKSSTDIARRMGYCWNTTTGGLYGGIKLLSHTGGFIHYALDNTASNGGIEMTDGFSNSEKYTSISTSRIDAGTASAPGNDVLSVVSSGGFNLSPGDSVEVSFALIAGSDLASIQASADAAQAKYDNIFIGILPVGKAATNELYQSFPNPSDKEVSISFSLKEGNETRLELYNVLGVKVKTIVEETLSTGRYSIPLNVSDLPAGNYYYRIQAGKYTKTLPLIIVH